MGDPEVGAADDAVLRVANAIEAYSAKYDDSGKPLTLAQLITRDPSGRSLLSDLHSGYEAVRTKHVDAHVTVVLVTNRSASTHDKLGGVSFSRLLTELFAKLRVDPTADVSPWQVAFDAIKAALGLDDQNTRAFLTACRFELAAESGNRLDGSPTRKADIQQLFEELWRQRSDRRARVVELSANEVLRKLGWRGRPGFANIQQFPINPDEYEPMGGALDALEAALASHEQGYIALLGGPGSGKSTLLQAFINSHPDMTAVRYFAYVQDDSPTTPREETRTFLHDICKQLRDNGIIGADSLLPDNIDELRSEFFDGLRSAGKRFVDSSRRTIIVIDGLDHVGRRRDIDQPLTHALPQPQLLPDGVLILLGSQHLDDVQGEVRAAVTTERTVRLDEFSLTADQVARIVGRTGRGFGPDIADTTYRVTNGHPLAVTLALEVLRAAPPEAATDALKALPVYTGSARAYFESLFSNVILDPMARGPFAILARLRRPLQHEWLAAWPTPEYETIKNYAYLFRRDDNIWTFVHDSLRHFLQLRTAEVVGEYSADEERAYQRKCADRCATSPIDLYRWEELYHRAMAEDVDAVLLLATQREFRQQYLGHRSVDHIRDDIDTALRFAVKHLDGLAVWRLLLALAELSQREYNAPPLDIWLILIRLGETAKALVASGLRETLTLASSDRLALAVAFHDAGRHALSRLLHRGVDATQLLEGYVNDQDETFTNWVRLQIEYNGAEAMRAAAPRLILLSSRITTRVSAIGGPDTDGGGDHLVRFGIGRGALSAGAIDIAMEQVLALQVDAREAAQDLCLHLALMLVFDASGETTDRALEIALEVLKRYRPHPLRLLEVAMALLNRGRTVVAKRMFDVAAGDPQSGADPFRDSDYLLLRERLALRLGELLPPIVEVPLRGRDPWPDPYLHFVLDDTIRKLATIDDVDITKASFKAIVSLVSRRLVIPKEFDPYGTRTYRLRDLLQTSAVTLFERAERGGPEWFETLFQSWFIDGSADLWSLQHRRQALERFGRSNFRTTSILDAARKLDADADNADASGRVASAHQRIKMWIGLGETQRAHRALDDLLTQNVGVGYRKDSQLSSFVSPLRSLYVADPTEARSAIGRLARKAFALQDIVEDRAPRAFIEDLIELSAEYDVLEGVRIAAAVGEWIGALVPLCRALARCGDYASAFDLLKNLIIPTHGEAEEQLTQEVFSGLGASPEADSFVAQVNAVGARRARRGWYRGATWGIVAAGDAVPDSLRAVERLPSDDRSSHYAPPPLTLREAFATTADLSSYEKRRIIKLVPAASDDAEVLEELSNRETEREVLGAAALRVLRSGNTSLARQIWQKAQDARRARFDGWLTFLDGGAQKYIFEVGIELGLTSSSDALSDFVRYASQLAAPVLALAAIPDALRVAGIDPDARSVWAECEDYLETLLKHVAEPPQVTDLPESTFGWIAGRRLDDARFAIRDPVRRYAVRAVQGNHLDAREWTIRQALNGNSAAAVILAASQRTKDVVSADTREILQQALMSGDGRARQAIDEFGWTEAVPEAVPTGRAVILIDNALERVRDIAGVIGVDRVTNISSVFDIDQDEVASTAIAVLQSADAAVSSSAEYLVDSEELQYCRLLAREVLGRLCEPGRLGLAADYGLRYFDPVLLSSELEPRPDVIREFTHSYGKDLPAATDILAQLPAASDPEWIILAETAYWQYRRSDLNVDRLRIRRGFVWRESRDRFDVVPNAGLTSAIDFPGHPLCLGEPFDMDDWFSANWVVLKPSFAGVLGWRLIPGSHFDYAAADGTVAARSVRWRDGAYGTSERISDGPKGLGAAVLARRTHIPDIERQLPGLAIASDLHLTRFSGASEIARRTDRL